MGIEKVSKAWLEYCSANPVLKVLLPISVPIVLVTAVLRVLQNFISFGSLAGTVIFLLFFLGILVTFAKSEFKMIAIGLGIYALDYAYKIIWYLISYQSINWSAILYLLVWGLFAFMAYKKSVAVNAGA